MRGETLARHLACRLIHPAEVNGESRREAIVAVKKGFDAARIRGPVRPPDL